MKSSNVKLFTVDRVDIHYYLRQQAHRRDATGAGARNLLRLKETTVHGMLAAIKRQFADKPSKMRLYKDTLADFVALLHRKTGPKVETPDTDWDSVGNGGHMRKTHGVEVDEKHDVE